MTLGGQKILLGITGSIAAYKAAHLTRLLVREGAEVKVVMTPDAAAFITPLTLATLSKNPVSSEYFDSKTGAWSNHIALAEWADLLLIAPATANTLAKMNAGMCDNLLLAVYLSMRGKVAAAPAMDLEMWQHLASKQNITALQNRGVLIIDPEEGELASGLSGKGRMAEPENILAAVRRELQTTLDFAGKRVLVSAGPTYEKIDPVRFIGNFSTGKMGVAIANELVQRGAEVKLVLGPVSTEILKSISSNIDVFPVQSAAEMKEECDRLFAQSDVAVMSAAVADYTPADVSLHKIKKAGDELAVTLKRTSDILGGLGAVKQENQILVGFALETENEDENAATKMKAKNLDMIVLNSLNDVGAGFAVDTNVITIFAENQRKKLPLMSKKEVAHEICNAILPLIKS